MWDEPTFVASHHAGHYSSAAEAGTEGAGFQQFSPSLFTSTMQDRLFACYVQLLHEIDAIPERLASWGEGCRCHERLVKHLSDGQRVALLKRHFQRPGGCPMAGKRAPELAAGHVGHVVEQLCGTLVQDVIAAHGPLSREQTRSMLADFIAVKDRISLNLQSKLDFWQRLPYLLAGISHDDTDVARRCATQCIEAWQRDPAPGHHHRVTQRFMDPHGVLHASLEEFAGGARLADLPEVFQAEIAKMRFIPVVETTIESKHAMVTRAGRRMARKGPVIVSLANRMPLLERMLQADAEVEGQPLFHLLLEKFGEARSFVNVPALLGISKAPALAEVMSQCSSRRSSMLGKPLTAVIYRADLLSKYIDLSHLKSANTKHKGDEAKRFFKAEQDAVAASSVVSERELRQAALLEHFHQLGVAGGIYSLPINAGPRIEVLSNLGWGGAGSGPSCAYYNMFLFRVAQLSTMVSGLCESGNGVLL